MLRHGNYPVRARQAGVIATDRNRLDGPAIGKPHPDFQAVACRIVLRIAFLNEMFIRIEVSLAAVNGEICFWDARVLE